MIDMSLETPPAPVLEVAPEVEPETEGSWLDRARLAAATVLDRCGRNPHGASLTGFGVEPWTPGKRPSPPAE